MEFAYPVTTADYIYYAHTWVQCLVYALCAVLAFWRARDAKDKLVWQFTAGAFLCYALADLFVNLYIAIYSIYPYFFSVAELAWFSIYVFFAAVCLYWLGGFSAGERAALKRHSLKAHLITAAVLVPVNVFITYLISENAFSNIFYAVGNYFILYLTLLLLFAAVKDGVRPHTRNYHIAILAYMALEILMFISSSLWESPVYNLFYVCSALQTILPFFILRTLGKEAAE